MGPISISAISSAPACVGQYSGSITINGGGGAMGLLRIIPFILIVELVMNYYLLYSQQVIRRLLI